MRTSEAALAKAGNTLVVPANLTDLASMVALAKGILADKPGGAGVFRGRESCVLAQPGP